MAYGNITRPIDLLPPLQFGNWLSPYLTLGTCTRVTVVILSVCVCYRASCYIPGLYVESRVPLGFLNCSQRVYCVDFVETTLFKSSGETCWSPLPSLLLEELSMDKRDSDGFFLRRLGCRTNDRSYNSNDSSLVTVDYQQSFLVFTYWLSSSQKC